MPEAANWRPHLVVMTLVICLAAGQRCSQAAPPPRTLPGVAQWLGAAADAEVDADSIAWEASGGPLIDGAFGRRVLFLARPAGEKQRDLFRAQARVSYEGQPIELQSLRNLTQTGLGDETALQVQGHYAVFASRAFGELQGVTLLDLFGSVDEPLPGSWFNRLLLKLRAKQETGSLAGLRRTHIGLADASRVELRLTPPTLALAVGDNLYQLDVESERFTEGNHNGTHSADDRAVVSTQRSGGRQWLHTLVDVVRAETGPDFIAWLEWRVFGLSDQLRRRAHAVFTEGAPSIVATTRPPASSESAWPPATVPSRWAKAHQLEDAVGVHVEGQWHEFAGVQAGAAEADSGDQQPLFVHTFVHPDAERPYARLWLLAMDMRRLELRMEAGYEEPRPQTGPPGRGSLPTDPEVLKRVVATFNGAFKSIHGNYGMMVERRVLVPPKPGAATVVVHQDGRVGLGDWPKERAVDPGLVSFRQNLDALVSDGEINPKARRQWGHRVVGHSALTERSALCLDGSGNLLYAWGKDLTADTLAAGLSQADCSYAIALDMNPGHTGWFFTDFGDGKMPESVQSRAAFAGMRVHPKKYALWSDKDFFYLLRRRLGPTGDDADLAWRPSIGSQPSPAVTPGIFERRLRIGTLEVRLLSIDPGRLNFALTAGNEPLIEGRPSPRRKLAPEQQAEALIALSMGHTTIPTRYGLAFGERDTLPLRLVYPTLLIEQSGSLRVVPEGEAVRLLEGQTAVQLPLLLEQGEVPQRVRQRGAFRSRGGLCVLDSGRVVVAMAQHDSSDILALALRDLGCRIALELDRASKHPVVVDRAGTARPIADEYDTTMLVGLDRPMLPRTYRFNSDRR